jgi:PadR family transcriptional regulator AphA
MNLQYAILGILTYFSLSGYNLGKLLNKAFNSFWNASLSQIYRELGKLEKKGYVSSVIQEQNDRPDKRVYSITPEGQKAFDKWLTQLPDTLTPPMRDEFALRIFFGGKLSLPQLRSQFERFLEEKKAISQTMIDNKQKIMEIVLANRNPDEKEEIGMRFIARRAQLCEQALIQWAEECLAEIDAISPQ